MIRRCGELVYCPASIEVLGVRPYLGRLIAPSDDVTPRTLSGFIITYRYWHRRFDGNAAVVGTALEGHRRTDDCDRRLAADIRRSQNTVPDRRGFAACRWRCRRKYFRQCTTARGVNRTTTLGGRRAAVMLIVGRLRRDAGITRAAEALTGVWQRYLARNWSAITSP